MLQGRTACIPRMKTAIAVTASACSSGATGRKDRDESVHESHNSAPHEAHPVQCKLLRGTIFMIASRHLHKPLYFETTSLASWPHSIHFFPSAVTAAGYPLFLEPYSADLP